MRALADLVAGHLHAVVPAGLQHGLAELLGPVGVRPLADGEVRGVLAERHGLVERGGAGLGARIADGGSEGAGPLDDLAQMLGRRTAAAADQGQAVVGHEGFLGVRQTLRAEREVRAVLGQHRQAGVRHAHQRRTRVLGQITQVLAHLGRARRAVQPDQVDAQRLQGGQRGADLGAEQHDAGRLEGE